VALRPRLSLGMRLTPAVALRIHFRDSASGPPASCRNAGRPVLVCDMREELSELRPDKPWRGEKGFTDIFLSCPYTRQTSEGKLKEGVNRGEALCS
jgi:hypothetical protein